MSKNKQTNDLRSKTNKFIDGNIYKNIIGANNLKINKQLSNTNTISTPLLDNTVPRHEPPMTKQWFNGIYSYNKNYIKSIPSADNIVSRIIKNFFSVQSLDNNKDKKKTKLSIRRFKRLSLNKILVGKPEIKHNNNVAIITLYLFNKKRKSLLRTLYLNFNRLNLPFNNLTARINNFKSEHNSTKTKDRGEALKQNIKNKKSLRGSAFVNKNTGPAFKKMIQNKWINYQINVKNIDRKRSLAMHKNKQDLLLSRFENKIHTFIPAKVPLLNKNINLSLITQDKSKSDESITKLHEIEINNANSKVLTYLSPKNKVKYIKNNFYLKNKNLKTSFFKVKNGAKLASFSHLFNLIYTSNKLMLRARKIDFKHMYKSKFKQHDKNILLVKKPINLKFKLYKKYFYFTENDFLFKNTVSKYSINAKKKYLKYNSIINLGYLETSLYKNNKTFNLSEQNNKFNNFLHSYSNNALDNKHFRKIIKSYYAYLNKYLVIDRYEDKALETNPYNKIDNNVNKKLSFVTQASGKTNRNEVNLKTSPKITFNKQGIETNKVLKSKFSKILLKLKSVHKLFTLKQEFKYAEKYHNIPFNTSGQNNNKTQGKFNSLSSVYRNNIKSLYYSNNIMLNWYKIWKKTITFNDISVLHKWWHNKLIRANLNIPEVVNEIENLDIKYNKGNSSLITAQEDFAYNTKSPMSKYSVKKRPYLLKTVIYKYSLASNNKFALTSALTKKYNFPLKLNTPLKKSKKLGFKQSSLNNRYTSNYGLAAKYKYLGRMRKMFLIGYKANKINKFCKLYYNVKYTNKKQSTITKLYIKLMVSYVKSVLNKEIAYLRYVKALSFNNMLFKSWFLTPLSNIISKVYNKKVIFNIVNLKYMHLNSDIFLQAIALRLRNSKKNRLNKVLRKALSIVKLSRAEPSAQDHNNTVYKYIEQHFNRFKQLNTSIFNEQSSFDLNNVNIKANNADAKALSIINKDVTNKINDIQKSFGVKDYGYNTRIKWLNNDQATTINLIKFKSVFGLKLQAAGRLTKRSTASRAVFKYRFKGGLKNIPEITRNKSTTLIKSNIISNLHYSSIASKTRNGSFGLKTWINNN